MKCAEVIDIASEQLFGLRGHKFNIVSVSRPESDQEAAQLMKVISKLSPALGNFIEYKVVERLNDLEWFAGSDGWVRQDPGFPDAVFPAIEPSPGFEIKAWFPLATEITVRFRESRTRLENDNTFVCIVVWLLRNVTHGSPFVVEVAVFSGLSVAQSRDRHYHKPPDYIVLEPEDTSNRTVNLRQTNTNGYKLQIEDPKELEDARAVVRAWGQDGRTYSAGAEYQRQIRELLGRFPYRLDTNYAKLDRIEHDGIKAFRTRVERSQINGLTVLEWRRMLRGASLGRLARELQRKNLFTEKNSDPLRE